MPSPFPASSSAPGDGHIIAALQPHGITALTKVTYQYPLKLISPSPTSHQKSVLAFLLTYGGGLVGGDQVNLLIDVLEGAKLSIVTQGHTKVFKSTTKDIVTRQTLEVNLEKYASLCLLPDPVQPFEESVYEQKQIFKVGEEANVCLLDWVSAGRTARGEEWDFTSWKGRNEIWAGGRLLLRDNVIIEGDIEGDETAGTMSLKRKMHSLSLFGTLVLKGPKMEGLADFMMKEFTALPRIGARDFRSQAAKDQASSVELSEEAKWRATRLEREKKDGILWSAAKVRGCTVVKFGAVTVEGGRHWVGDMVRREGSVLEVFGYDAAMCIHE